MEAGFTSSSGSKLSWPTFAPPLAHPGRVHAEVDHQVGDVDALRAELARHALRHGPEAELRAGEGGEAGAAAQAGGGAGEDDGAAAARQHQARRLPPGEEARVAGHLPHLAEHPLGGVEDGEVDVGADVEDADLERRGALGLGQEPGDRLLLAGVEGAAAAPPAGRLDLGDQGRELLAVAAPGEDGVAAGREAARDGGADEVAGADHGDRGVACLVHRDKPLSVFRGFGLLGRPPFQDLAHGFSGPVPRGYAGCAAPARFGRTLMASTAASRQAAPAR